MVAGYHCLQFCHHSIAVLRIARFIVKAAINNLHVHLAVAVYILGIFRYIVRYGVCLLIKRGVIVCEFVIANNDLRNYMSDNKLKLKQAPTTLKVFDEATLAAAKATMEIAVKAIEDEKAYKKEQARAKRKAAKAAAEAEATAATETTTDAE